MSQLETLNFFWTPYQISELLSSNLISSTYYDVKNPSYIMYESFSHFDSLSLSHIYTSMALSINSDLRCDIQFDKVVVYMVVS